MSGGGGPHVSDTRGRSNHGQTRVNSPELTHGSSPAEPETAEGCGFPPPATKWPAESVYVTRALVRVE